MGGLDASQVLSAVLGFGGLAALLTLVPGADTTLVLRAAIARGRRAAAATGLGVALGVLVWGVLAAVGLVALLQALPAAYLAVQVAGGLYLLFLAARLLRSAWRPAPEAAEADEVGPTPSPWSDLRQGLLTNVLNPKVGVFYLATLPAFLPADGGAAWLGVLLAGVHAALTLAWFAALAQAAHAARAVLGCPAVRRGIDAVAGVVLTAFAAMVLVGALG